MIPLGKIYSKNLHFENDAYTTYRWDQRKVNQEMCENSWRELMQNLGQLVKVTERLVTHNN